MSDDKKTLEERERELAREETKSRFLAARELAEQLKEGFSTTDVIELARLMLEVEVASRNAPNSSVGPDGKYNFRKRP